jgi:hypothetical protein
MAAGFGAVKPEKLNRKKVVLFQRADAEWVRTKNPHVRKGMRLLRIDGRRIG